MNTKRCTQIRRRTGTLDRCKGKRDPVLFFHSSTLRYTWQGQARRGLNVLVPNDISVFPPIVRTRGVSERGPMRRNARAAAAELVGPVTPPAPTASSGVGHVDSSLPHSLGFRGRFPVVAGSTGRRRFLNTPACELLWHRQNDYQVQISQYIPYVQKL